MIKKKIATIISHACELAIKQGELRVSEPLDETIVLTTPRRKELGDYACGIALKLAALAKMTPTCVAQTICDFASEDLKTLADTQIASNGFINFRIKDEFLQKLLEELLTWKQTAAVANSAAEEPIVTGRSSFPIKYAYARCSSFVRLATNPQLNFESLKEAPAILAITDLSQFFSIKTNVAGIITTLFKEKKADERTHETYFEDPVRNLLLHLSQFFDLNYCDATKNANFKQDIFDFAEHASFLLENFLGKTTILSENSDLVKAKIALLFACKNVLAYSMQTLKLDTAEYLLG